MRQDPKKNDNQNLLELNYKKSENGFGKYAELYLRLSHPVSVFFRYLASVFRQI